MNRIIYQILFFLLFAEALNAQNNSTPDFTWGNTTYFNLHIGEKIHFLQKEIKLISINNQCNKIVVEGDTVLVKISQRTIPEHINGLKIFVADNRNLNSIDENSTLHGLLTKDVLIGVSYISTSLLDDKNYVFPVNFNEGFTWDLESDNYLFSVIQQDNNFNKFIVNSGIYFNLQDEKALAKHWTVAIENSRVVWIENYKDDKESGSVAVLLESESQPGIFYYYGNLDKKDIEVREGQKLQRGELIGTVDDGKAWGPAYFSVLKSDTIPGSHDVHSNVINFFPQLFELYYNRSFSFLKLFSKGNIFLGKTNPKNEKNNLCFEEYAGKGWLLGCWNKAGKVPFVEINNESNIRLQKVLFEDTKFECNNPENYYDYEINVNNGSFRIRVKVGDAELETWQKVEFENRTIGEFALESGVQVWTSEHIIRVNDGKLTVRIYVDPKNKTAGLSEIVFQRVQ